ncbi:MAG: hypothetical protein P4K80_08445 [Acidobacteriaceae bacterium]|nr:hypothetical protein [Acidobacteriaceae bacterium]
MLAAFAFPVGAAMAQDAASGQETQAMLTLPNAPGFHADSSSGNATLAATTDFSAKGVNSVGKSAAIPQASAKQMKIEPGQAAPTLTAGDKALLGVKDALSPMSALGWLVSAGWEQLNDGSPNYGTDRGAFGERLGIAAVRGASEDILSNSVMANLLHEDPRYYRMGPDNNIFRRGFYAVTRPIITRTDSGRHTLNFAQMSGNLGGIALTNLYYPQANRGAKQTMESFGTSFAGSAAGDLVSEFFADAMHIAHLGHY